MDDHLTRRFAYVDTARLNDIIYDARMGLITPTDALDRIEASFSRPSAISEAERAIQATYHESTAP